MGNAINQLEQDFVHQQWEPYILYGIALEPLNNEAHETQYDILIYCRAI